MTTTSSSPGPTTPLPTPTPSPPPTSHRSLSGLAGWCARHRWRTLAAALLVVTGAVLLLGGGLRSTDAVDQLVGDSAEAARLSAGADFGDGPVESVVVTGDLGDVPALSQRLVAAYRGVDGVTQVGTPVTSADGRTLVLALTLDPARDADGSVADPTAADPEDVAAVLERTDRLRDDLPGLAVGQFGAGSVDAEVGETLERDFARAELISVPVTLGVLLVAFGAVVAAGIPVLLGVASVATALGLTALASRELMPVDQNTQSLVLLIGLAVGVDYSLFVIRRAREERAAGASVPESVAAAGRTAGRAVLVSGLTVVVAMSGMLVAGGMFTSVAVGAMLVVAVAVLAATTVLPALLAVLGDRVESLRLPFSRRRAARRGSPDGTWGRLAGRVVRRPVLWTAVSAAVLLALAAPALGMRTALPGTEGLPTSFRTVEAYERLTAAFPQDGTTVDVVVRAPAEASTAVTASLAAAFDTAVAGGDVVGDAPVVRSSVDGTVHELKLAVPMESSDVRLGDVVERIRTDVATQVTGDLSDVAGAQVHVGGAAAVTDLTQWLDERLPWIVGFVLVLTLVVMLFAFGSPALAAATVALNALSVAAAYGVITLVFQNTWAEGLLGFTSIGSIAAWLPMLMFVVLFGLSMDYHVFVVSRVREAWRAGSSPREAVRLGVARSAGVVTSAAAVMVAVFAVFGTLSTLEMKQLGVGLATAVLLDATLVRGVLLPAVLALLGRRAHTGPRWLPALHP